MTEPVDAQPGDITLLLRAAQSGDRAAEDKLFARVYDELHRIARRVLAREREAMADSGSVVHEAYMRLAGGKLPGQDRDHFFAIAARTMRRLLVDRARARQTVKRGRGEVTIPLEGVEFAAPAADPIDVLEVDHALRWLAKIDEKLVRVAELRVFAGLCVEEVAG